MILPSLEPLGLWAKNDCWSGGGVFGLALLDELLDRLAGRPTT